ncbi:hypothetical protein [uncultured Brachyspira sp.]|uniref:hypothetical protein n=1 Tax=uncultured Brachyspira sp. TaxID=221953 RepID=UPI002601B47C|nr:hypothetical protein [uncultured Brachyspira sp.]
MMGYNKYIIIPVFLLVSAVIVNFLIDYYIMPKRFLRTDQAQHFYDMKQWYDSNKLPTTSARLVPSEIVNEANNIPRVPGGAYYIFYTLFYKLSGENYFISRIINLIFNLIIIYLFLFWFYKRFGIILSSFIASLILCNVYIILAISDFLNQHITLIFSFLLFILLFEYIDTTDENDKRKNTIKLSAVFTFPILAIMAQGHFFTFFSMIPTVIVYLIIKHKRTLKYIFYWALGVFISFLEYLPYLISELQSNFSNLKMAITLRDSVSSIPFPQIYALLLYPTNEISMSYGSGINAIISYWTKYPFTILGVAFLFLSLIFSLFCFVRILYCFFNKNYKAQSNNEKVILDMFYIFLLFIPVTIIINILSHSKSGVIHYLYSMFAISYLPIILFFVQYNDKLKSNKKIFYIISLLLFINLIVLYIQNTVYIKYYEEPRNLQAMENVVKTIYDDSKNSDANVIGIYAHNNMYRDIAITFFTNNVWKQNEDSTNIYFVFDNIASLSQNTDVVSNYMTYFSNNSKLLYSNLALLVYKYNSGDKTFSGI